MEGDNIKLVDVFGSGQFRNDLFPTLTLEELITFPISTQLLLDTQDGLRTSNPLLADFIASLVLQSQSLHPETENIIPFWKLSDVWHNIIKEFRNETGKREILLYMKNREILENEWLCMIYILNLFVLHLFEYRQMEQYHELDESDIFAQTETYGHQTPLGFPVISRSTIDNVLAHKSNIYIWTQFINRNREKFEKKNPFLLSEIRNTFNFPDEWYYETFLEILTITYAILELQNLSDTPRSINMSGLPRLCGWMVDDLDPNSLHLHQRYALNKAKSTIKHDFEENQYLSMAIIDLLEMGQIDYTDDIMKLLAAAEQLVARLKFADVVHAQISKSNECFYPSNFQVSHILVIDAYNRQNEEIEMKLEKSSPIHLNWFISRICMEFFSKLNPSKQKAYKNVLLRFVYLLNNSRDILAPLELS